MSKHEYFDKSNTSNCSGVSSPQQWGRARFNLFHTIRVCRTSFSSLSFNPDRFWRDDWRSVGALIPWSGSRCHSKGTRPVWSAVECLSGHGSLWFPGQRENRLSCPKVPLLFMGDNRTDGLTAIDPTIANWWMNSFPIVFPCTCLAAVRNLYNLQILVFNDLWC